MTATIDTVQGGLIVATQAHVIGEEEVTAWADAHDSAIEIRPDVGWIRGRYVAGDMFNSNGHWFPGEDIAATHAGLIGMPMNMLHKKRYIVGSYADTDLVQPELIAREDTTYTDTMFVDALAKFYRAIYPDEWRAVKAAHEAGMAWFSMEAWPSTMTCKVEGGCGETFPFKGLYHESYCDELNVPRSKKVLHKPLWLGGGLILPPARPGWNRADLTMAAGLITNSPELAEDIYNSVASDLPELDPADWEWMMSALLAAGAGDDMPDRPARAPGFDFARAAAQTVADEIAVTGPVGPETKISRGIAIVLVPPAGIAERIAAQNGVTEPAEDLHITLAYLGKVDDRDLAPSEITMRSEYGYEFGVLHSVVAAFATQAPPIKEVRLSGTGTFQLPATDDLPAVTYASVDAPGLAEFRSRLVTALAAADIPLGSEHGFTPHMSIAYHALGAGPNVTFDDLDVWEASEIELWWQNSHMPFPLAGGAVPFAGLIADLSSTTTTGNPTSTFSVVLDQAIAQVSELVAGEEDRTLFGPLSE